MNKFFYGMFHPIEAFKITMTYGTTPLKTFAVCLYVVCGVGGFIGGVLIALHARGIL